jgi:hypothetical protein
MIKISPSNAISALFFVVPLCTALYFGGNIFLDPDAAWHLKSGQMIWQNLAIPHGDSWSFASDQRWYNISWLWDVITYLIYLIGNERALFYFQAVLFATSVWGMFKASDILLPNDCSLENRAVAVTLCSLMIWDILFFRPQLLTYLLALLALVITSRHRLIWLVPITVLWCNLHGSFLVIYIIMSAFIVGEIHDRRILIDRHWHDLWNMVKRWLLPVVLCLIVPLFNPDHYNIFPGILRTLDSVMLPFIVEWRPFGFGRMYGNSLLIAILLLVGGLHVKTPTHFKLLGIFWLFAALSAQRNFGYFAILGMPYIAAAIRTLIESSKAPLPGKIWNVLVPTLSICAALILSISHIFWISPPPHGQHIPTQAIKFLNENCSNAKLFNDYNTGGYLAWWLRDDIKHFVDGRAGTAFSESMLQQYLDAINQDEEKALYEIFNRYEITLALVNKNLVKHAHFNAVLANWKMIYSDAEHKIYQKNGTNACKKVVPLAGLEPARLQRDNRF